MNNFNFKKFTLILTRSDHSIANTPLGGGWACTCTINLSQPLPLAGASWLLAFRSRSVKRGPCHFKYCVEDCKRNFIRFRFSYCLILIVCCDEENASDGDGVAASLLLFSAALVTVMVCRIRDRPRSRPSTLLVSRFTPTRHSLLVTRYSLLAWLRLLVACAS